MNKRELRQAVFEAGYNCSPIKAVQLFSIGKISRQEFNDLLFKGFVRSGKSGKFWPF